MSGTVNLAREIINPRGALLADTFLKTYIISNCILNVFLWP